MLATSRNNDNPLVPFGNMEGGTYPRSYGTVVVVLLLVLPSRCRLRQQPRECLVLGRLGRLGRCGQSLEGVGLGARGGSP